jgi:hypothetical protein
MLARQGNAANEEDASSSPHPLALSRNGLRLTLPGVVGVLVPPGVMLGYVGLNRQPAVLLQGGLCARVPINGPTL